MAASSRSSSLVARRGDTDTARRVDLADHDLADRGLVRPWSLRLGFYGPTLCVLCPADASAHESPTKHRPDTTPRRKTDLAGLPTLRVVAGSATDSVIGVWSSAAKRNRSHGTTSSRSWSATSEPSAGRDGCRERRRPSSELDASGTNLDTKGISQRHATSRSPQLAPLYEVGAQPRLLGDRVNGVKAVRPTAAHRVRREEQPARIPVKVGRSIPAPHAGRGQRRDAFPNVRRPVADLCRYHRPARHSGHRCVLTPLALLFLVHVVHVATRFPQLRSSTEHDDSYRPTRGRLTRACRSDVVSIGR